MRGFGAVLAGLAFSTTALAADNLADLPGQLGLGPIRFCMAKPDLLAASRVLRDAPPPTPVPVVRARPDPFVLSGMTGPVRGCRFTAALAGDKEGLSAVFLRLVAGDRERCAQALERRWSRAYGPPRTMRYPLGTAGSQTDEYWQQGPFTLDLTDYATQNAAWLMAHVDDLSRAPNVLSDSPAGWPSPCVDGHVGPGPFPPPKSAVIPTRREEAKHDTD